MIKGLSNPDEEELNKRKVKLNRKSGHDKVIIFDLDETLFHCNIKDKTKRSDIMVDVLGN